MSQDEHLEREWQTVTRSLKSYIEHPEQHTATIFMRTREQLRQETIDRLREEKNICVGAYFGGFHMISRAPGNADDSLAKPVSS